MSKPLRIIMMMDVNVDECDPNTVEELVDMWTEIMWSEIESGTDLQEICLSVSRAVKAVMTEATDGDVMLH